MTGDRGLKYVSIHEASGYGESARRYLRALRRGSRALTWEPMVLGMGWNLGYEPLGDRPFEDDGAGIDDPDLTALRGREIDYDTVIVHTVPEYYPLWRAREPCKRMIGYTTWETDRPPDHWPPLLNVVDALWVPCEWNREVFRRHGVTVPIDVVPHIAHPGPFSAETEDDRWTCYVIGPWTDRKAHWNAIEAFARAFRSGDPVRLVLKTSPEDLTRGRRWRRFFSTRRATKRLLRRHADPPAVELVTERLPQEAIDALHRRGDCYLALGYGEGWSLPAFDAAAHANPVVATRFGGPLAYLGDDDSYLVDTTLGPAQSCAGPSSYHPTQRWGIPDLDDAARWMRHAFEDRAEARKRGALAAERIRERYSEAAILEQMMSLL